MIAQAWASGLLGWLQLSPNTEPKKSAQKERLGDSYPRMHSEELRFCFTSAFPFDSEGKSRESWGQEQRELLARGFLPRRPPSNPPSSQGTNSLSQPAWVRSAEERPGTIPNPQPTGIRKTQAALTVCDAEDRVPLPCSQISSSQPSCSLVGMRSF